MAAREGTRRESAYKLEGVLCAAVVCLEQCYLLSEASYHWLHYMPTLCACVFWCEMLGTGFGSMPMLDMFRNVGNKVPNLFEINPYHMTHLTLK